MVVQVCAVPLPITEQLFVKKNITNLVLQVDEIVRFNIKDYFSGSFLAIDGEMTNVKTNVTMPLDGSLIKLTDPYTLSTEVSFNCEVYQTTMHNTYKLIIAQDKDSMKRTYLFFITE